MPCEEWLVGSAIRSVENLEPERSVDFMGKVQVVKKVYVDRIPFSSYNLPGFSRQRLQGMK
jgi:hypothetical protein